MSERIHDGRPFRILNVMVEYMRECLVVKVERHLDHEDMQACLTELFFGRCLPGHLRSDNGAEFIASALRAWLDKLSVKPLFIEPGSPWEIGYLESLNGKMREISTPSKKRRF
jgi:putative transposase